MRLKRISSLVVELVQVRQVQLELLLQPTNCLANHTAEKSLLILPCKVRSQLQVMLMLIISLTSHRLGLETGLSVALFPMVIIAMTIERMSVVWEERGAADAIRAGLGSLFVAVAAYVFMGMSWLEHLIFTFPELLLVILALVVLAGRYTGYRLTELQRFKALRSG